MNQLIVDSKVYSLNNKNYIDKDSNNTTLNHNTYYHLQDIKEIFNTRNDINIININAFNLDTVIIKYNSNDDKKLKIFFNYDGFYLGHYIPNIKVNLLIKPICLFNNNHKSIVNKMELELLKLNDNISFYEKMFDIILKYLSSDKQYPKCINDMEKIFSNIKYIINIKDEGLYYVGYSNGKEMYDEYAKDIDFNCSYGLRSKDPILKECILIYFENANMYKVSSSWTDGFFEDIIKNAGYEVLENVIILMNDGNDNITNCTEKFMKKFFNI